MSLVIFMGVMLLMWKRTFCALNLLIAYFKSFLILDQIKEYYIAFMKIIVGFQWMLGLGDIYDVYICIIL